MNYIKIYFVKYAAWVTHVVTIIGLFFVAYQVYQGNEHKKWENYNSLNIRYYELYSQIPEVLEHDSCIPFENHEKKIKVWVRSYLNLYSEEYWLHLHGLMPEEMWGIRINNGADVNFVNYPLLIKGYQYWKGKGSFIHPEGFIILVDRKIKAHQNKLNLLECK